VARNRSRKPGRPLGRRFDSFTFRQFSHLPSILCSTLGVPLLLPVCKTGVYETGRSADERFESSGAHQFQQSENGNQSSELNRGL
jgi:hypothetical protein